MSAPLGTFNSEERVQISTAIRLARQLPPGSTLFPSSLLSFEFPPPSVSLPVFRVFTRTGARNALVGICAEEGF